jgi:hypothetical protein
MVLGCHCVHARGSCASVLANPMATQVDKGPW